MPSDRPRSKRAYRLRETRSERIRTRSPYALSEIPRCSPRTQPTQRHGGLAKTRVRPKRLSFPRWHKAPKPPNNACWQWHGVRFRATDDDGGES